jgi:hypothetical protein
MLPIPTPGLLTQVRELAARLKWSYRQLEDYAYNLNGKSIYLSSDEDLTRLVTAMLNHGAIQ